MRPILLGALIALAGVGLWAAFATPAAQGEVRDADPADLYVPVDGGFADIARVLRHPRCLNCHPSGDRPHVADEARLHGMNVQRGPDGHGMPGQRCETCHHEDNQPLAGVPGAPHWHLAPRSMGWVGLDDHDLALALKDRQKNGNRSLDDVLQHVSTDPLVLWAWKPGPGRSAPPISHERFIAAFRAWIEADAPLPTPGTTTH